MGGLFHATVSDVAGSHSPENDILQCAPSISRFHPLCPLSSLLDLWFALPAPSPEQMNVKQRSIIGLKGMEYNGRRVKEGFVTIFIGAGLETRDSGFFTGGDDLAWRRIAVFRVR